MKKEEIKTVVVDVSIPSYFNYFFSSINSNNKSIQWANNNSMIVFQKFKKNECSICFGQHSDMMNPYKNDNATFHQKCLSVFHKDCLRKWITTFVRNSSSYICPVCKHSWNGPIECNKEGHYLNLSSIQDGCKNREIKYSQTNLKKREKEVEKICLQNLEEEVKNNWKNLWKKDKNM